MIALTLLVGRQEGHPVWLDPCCYSVSLLGQYWEYRLAVVLGPTISQSVRKNNTELEAQGERKHSPA